jgi:hypothetical protein
VASLGRALVATFLADQRRWKPRILLSECGVVDRLAIARSASVATALRHRRWRIHVPYSLPGETVEAGVACHPIAGTWCGSTSSPDIAPIVRISAWRLRAPALAAPNYRA